MPRSAHKKPVEIQQNKLSEYSNVENLKKFPSIAKEIGNVRQQPKEDEAPLSQEHSTRPQRKPSQIPKLKKIDDEDKGKKSGSLIIDKVPKKSAQRAKGSTSIGKAREKSKLESAEKKRPPSSPSPGDKISRPNTTDEAPSLPPRNNPPRNTEKPLRSNRKVKESKSELREEKGKKRKPWVSVLDKDSQELNDEEEKKGEDQPKQNIPSRDLNQVFQDMPSCSFFEKIQQGVKAYFSFRNTFRDFSGREDPNKKKITEGGIIIGGKECFFYSKWVSFLEYQTDQCLGMQTSAGVAKGYKEDKKKRKRKVLKNNRIKFKNQIYSKDYLFNRPRLNLSKSESRGKFTIFSTFNPNNLHDLQKLKRIKLNRPKKHYVRIQIPRKGYFYRSISQSKNQKISPALCVYRMESTDTQEIPSKIEVHTFVPASAKTKRVQKIINKFNQKTKSLKPSTKSENISLVKTVSNRSTAVLQHFSNTLQSRSSHNPSLTPQYTRNSECLEARLTGSIKNYEKNPSVAEEKITNMTNKIDEEKEKGDRRAVLENLPKLKNVDTKNRIRRQKNFKNEKQKEKMSNIKESLNEKSMFKQNNDCDVSIQKNKKLSEEPKEKPSITSFDTLFKCLNSGLPIEEFSFSDKIPDFSILADNPLESGSGEKTPFYIETFCQESEELECTKEEPLPATLKAMNVLDDTECNPLSEEQSWISAVSLIVSESDSNKQLIVENISEDATAAPLLGEIDLHLELENYLKSMDNNTIKTRTKNTLQQCHFMYPDTSDFTDAKHQFNDLNFQENKFEIDSETYFYNVIETKSNFSFNSALSFNNALPKQEGDANNLNMFRDKKKNLNSFSQEQLLGQLDKTFTSQISFLSCKNNNSKESIRKTESETDQSEPLPEVKSESFLKKSFGNASFYSLNTEPTKPMIPSIFFKSQTLLSLYSIQKSSAGFDTYEKIIPLMVRSCENKKKTTKSYILDKISNSSLWSGSLKSKASNTSIQPNCIPLDKTQPAEQINEIDKTDLDLKMTSANEQSSILKEEKNWSPTLLELIDIYSAILKKTAKIKSSSNKSIKFSNLLYSFFAYKLTEKKKLSELIEFSQNISRNFLKKSKNLFEKLKPNKKELSLQLTEYVNLCQELLLSSLSINQITQLNNILANVPKSFKGTNNTFKKSNIECKKNINERKKPEIKLCKQSKQVPVFKTTKQKKFEPKTAVEFKKPQRKTEFVKLISPQKKVIPPKIEKAVNFKFAPKCIAKKCESLPPPELEPILKTCFSTYKTYGDKKPKEKAPPQSPNDRNKFSVTVKLSNGNVFVDKIQNVEIEKKVTMIKAKHPKIYENTSELIFENVSKNRPDKYKPPNPKFKRKISDAKKETSVQKNLKITKAQTNKTETLFKSAVEKYKQGMEGKDNECNELFTNFKVKENLNTFEYDQELLKIQHPINAIAENSEPKLNDHLQEAEEMSTQPQELYLKVGQIHNKGFSNDVIQNQFQLNASFKKSSSLNKKEEVIALSKATSSLTFRLGKVSIENLNEKTKSKKEEKKKSVDDTALMKTSELWKTRKVLQMTPYTSYICYSSYQNLYENQKIKNKKISRDPDFGQRERKANQSAYTGFLKVTSSNRSRQSLLTKNPSKNLNQKRAKSGVKKYEGNMNLEKPKRTEKLKMSRNENNQIQTSELSAKVSTNTILFLNAEILPEKCSVEFIFNDKTVNESLNFQESLVDPQEKFLATEIQKVLETFYETSKPNNPQEPATPSTSKAKTCQNSSPALSILEIEKLLQKPSAIRPLNQSNSLEPTIPSLIETNTCENSLATISRNSPLIIHSARAENNGESFPALMIQSDTILNSRSTFALTKSKFKTLFKSNSDMQFYPGRISDSEEGPLITFVLTPKQKATAGIPSKQVTVVEKSQWLVEEKPENCPTDVETNVQDSLESIEKFVNILSKAATKIIRHNYRRNINEISKHQSNSSLSKNSRTLPKCFMPCQRLQALNNHCQKSAKRLENIERKNSLIKENRNKVKAKSKDTLKIVPEVKKEIHKAQKLATVPLKSDQNATKEINNHANTSLMCLAKRNSGKISKSFKNDLSFEVEEENYVKQLAESDMLCESSSNLIKKSDTSKKLKKFKIKIHCCNRHLDFRSFKSNKTPQNRKMVLDKKSILEQIQKIDASDISDVNCDDLSSDSSDFFDASEKESQPESNQFLSSNSDSKNIVSAEYLKGEFCQGAIPHQNSPNKFKSIIPAILTPSDESLLSNSLTPNLEIQISNKILKELQSNNIYYSMLLLENYLKMIENQQKEIVYSEKLKDILRNIEKKSRNLIDDLERRGWLKILSILDNVENEFSKGFSAGNTENWVYKFMDFMEKQLKNTQIILDKFQILKEKKLNLKNLASNESQSESSGEIENRRNFLFKVRQWFKQLKDKVNDWSQGLIKNSIKNMADCEKDSDSVDEFHQNFEKNPEKDLESLVQNIRKQLANQNISVENHLMFDNSAVFPESHETKNKVSVILTHLEKIIFELDEYLKLEENKKEDILKNFENKINLEGSSSNVNYTRTNEKSFLNLSGICKVILEKSGMSSDENSNYVRGNSGSGSKYPGIMRTFMKIWEVRKCDSSLSTI